MVTNNSKFLANFPVSIDVSFLNKMLNQIIEIPQKLTMALTPNKLTDRQTHTPPDPNAMPFLSELLGEDGHILQFRLKFAL